MRLPATTARVARMELIVSPSAYPVPSAGFWQLPVPDKLVKPGDDAYPIPNGLSGFCPFHHEFPRPAMLLDKLRTYFQTSPAASLLRSPNAPFILDFLIQTFKQGGRITVPYSELHAALLAYREGIQESYPDALQARSKRTCPAGAPRKRAGFTASPTRDPE